MSTEKSEVCRDRDKWWKQRPSARAPAHPFHKKSTWNKTVTWAKMAPVTWRKTSTWHLWQTWMHHIVSRFTAVRRNSTNMFVWGSYKNDKHFRNKPRILFLSLKGLYPKQACIKHLLQVRRRAYTSNTTREKQQEHKVANIQVIHLSKQTRVRDNTKGRWVVVWFLRHGSWLKNFCIKIFARLRV